MPWLRCPHCTILFTTDGQPGTVLNCPACHGGCRVPAVPALAPPAAAPPPDAIQPSPHAEYQLAAEDVIETLPEEPTHYSPPAPAPDDDEVLDYGLQVVATPERRRPATEEPATDDGYYDQPAARARHRGRRRKGPVRTTRGLDKVNLGLGFHYARLLVLLVSVGLLYGGIFVGSILLTFGGGAGSVKSGLMGLGLIFVVSAIAGFLISFIAPILGLVGSALCLWVPAQSGGKGFIIASLALDGVALVMGLVLRLVGLAMDNPIPGLVGVGFSYLLGCFAWAMFMVFLGRVCAYIDQPKMAEESGNLLIQGAVIMAVSPLLLLVVGALAVVPFAGIILSLGLLLASLKYFFKFLRLQLDLVGSIRQVIWTRF
jgi:hypothetical protein